MGEFFLRHRWLTAALVVVLAFVTGFGLWSRWITAEPLDTPLAASPPGRVATDVHVRLSCPHRLILHLFSQTRTREEMRRLAGQYGTAEGVEIPLRWSFRDAAGRVVAQGEAENLGSDGFDAEGFDRSASGWLPLPPGRYRLDAALAGEVARLQGVSVRLHFRCHPKSSAGWQTDLLYFGSFAWLVACLLAAGLALLLIGLAIRERGRLAS